MDVGARVSSKGQIDDPRAVREALALREGDRVMFRVEHDRAIMARTADLLELAGSIPVPADRRGAAWADVLRETRSERASHRR